MTTITSVPEGGFRFALSHEAYWKWANDESMLVIIEGELGVGKSSFCVQLLREFYGDDWKKYIVYKPEDFLNLVDGLIMKDPPIKIPVLVWDDAGNWLYSMDFADERVKSVVKFINVMRTVLGCLILTTPTSDMIVGKIPKISGIRVATVNYSSGRKSQRQIKIAKMTKTRWGKRWMVDYAEDWFNVMLPMSVYNDYKPLRDMYARESNVQMRQAWHDRLRKASSKVIEDV